MKIPAGWHELTINQFQELLPSKFEGMNDISKVINEIMILSNEPYEEVAKLTNKDVDNIREQTKWLSEERPNVLKTRYKIKGQWYRFEVDATNVILDQYAFSMKTLETLKDNPETVESNLHLLLANISRPIKRNWRGKFVDVKEYDLLEMSEIFKHNMTMDIANPIIVFFCTLSKNLTKVTSDYLTEKVEKMEKAQKDLADTVGL